MSGKDSKFGKKKSGNKFNREKTFASSEADILLADEKQKTYKEERTVERHQRRVDAGLEVDTTQDVNEKEHVLKEKVEEKEINKKDIKKFGSQDNIEIWHRNYMVFKNGVKVISGYFVLKYVLNYFGIDYYNWRGLIGI